MRDVEAEAHFALGREEAALATRMADALLAEGVYVIGFSYPVVPKGKARIRTQMSAAHTAEQIRRAAAASSGCARSRRASVIAVRHGDVATLFVAAAARELRVDVGVLEALEGDRYDELPAHLADKVVEHYRNLGYVTAMLLESAMQACGRNLTRACLIQKLEQEEIQRLKRGFESLYQAID